MCYFIVLQGYPIVSVLFNVFYGDKSKVILFQLKNTNLQSMKMIYQWYTYLYIIRACWNFDEQTLPNVNVLIKRFHYLKV